jgi:16S rRNA (cytosine967-C5)-methyltransferase
VNASKYESVSSCASLRSELLSIILANAPEPSSKHPLSIVAASPSLAQSLAAAGRVIGHVLDGESLNTALIELKRRADTPTLAAAAQDLSYNALRGFGVVDVVLDQLLEKPVAAPALKGLLLAAISELAARPQAAHAVVHQAVEGAVLLGESRAKGLVNAVLREFQRRASTLLAGVEATETGRYRYPQWWIERVRAAYPDAWKTVLLESNRHPPMTLRVNRRRLSAGEYLERLHRAGIPARWLGAEAVVLEKPRGVGLLPGFTEGVVSVQDAGAQRAAPLLDIRDGMRVLDACAAPGGKTGHILELASCELTAVDADAHRARRITENLDRLKLSARVVVGDCRRPDSFSDNRPFDRILLDAPCTASGVVRRHPDIKWLRRPDDIGRFAGIQSEMLDAMWQLLAPDGKLLYTTCSVFTEENGEQVRAFLERHPEAVLLPLPELSGGQILPCVESDGFYYGLLHKVSE